MGSSDLNDLVALRAENARLISLLESHGIEWRLPPPPTAPYPEPEPSRLSTDEKIALFRRLFRGRTDVYPIRWGSKTTGKTGYSPACANEWLAGVCEKPRIKCGECNKCLLIPLSDSVIRWQPPPRHATKTDVRIIDFVDTGHPALLRMWGKRQREYWAMGYRVVEHPQDTADLRSDPNNV